LYRHNAAIEREIYDRTYLIMKLSQAQGEFESIIGETMSELAEERRGV